MMEQRYYCRTCGMLSTFDTCVLTLSPNMCDTCARVDRIPCSKMTRDELSHSRRMRGYTHAFKLALTDAWRSDDARALELIAGYYPVKFDDESRGDDEER